MDEQKITITETPEAILTIKNSEMSEWECYMFGNVPGGYGLKYHPEKGKVPNWFVRLMMKICFACTWRKI